MSETLRKYHQSRYTPSGQLTALMRGALGCEAMAKLCASQGDAEFSLYWAKEAREIRQTIEATKHVLNTTT